MRILIANDDGIYSPGIVALAEAAAEFGDVKIVAPDVEQSSMGHAITHRRPLSFKKTKVRNFEAYRVDGTPADCVALGFYVYDKVDVVLSGINLGLNLGNSMWHSGTLAAAKQGSLFGLKGIAFSTPHLDCYEDFEPLLPYVSKVLKMLLDREEMSLVNVNIPVNPKGIKWTKQSARHYDGKVVPGKDPMGREHYWITIKPVEELDKETDRWAVEHDFVSVTPLRLNLTDEDYLHNINGNVL
jgi:5'-nucleotidase